MNCSVVAEIFLAGNKDDGNVWTEVVDFWDPAFLDVLEGVGVVHRVTEKENVGVGVR